MLFVVGAINWYLVFNERARRRWGFGGWYLLRRGREGRELEDGLAIATSLIVAVLCSSIIVVALVFALIKIFK